MPLGNLVNVFVVIEDHDGPPMSLMLPGVPAKDDLVVVAGARYFVTVREWHVTHAIVYVSPEDT